MSEVMDSFHRARKRELAERFYEIFLDADPRFRPMFKHTDFTRQKELLTHSIMMLLEYSDGKATGKMAIDRLAELHSRKRMNIEEDMYPIWMDCLMKAVAKTDPQFSPDLEKKWRNSLQKGITVMISRI